MEKLDLGLKTINVYTFFFLNFEVTVFEIMSTD
jgi:hypothetical protein